MSSARYRSTDHTNTMISYLHSIVTTCSTMCLKSNEPLHLTFDRNFGKRRPIFKILSRPDSWGHFVLKFILHHLILSMFLHHLVKTWKLQLLPISMAYCILHVIPQNSSSKKWGRFNSPGLRSPGEDMPRKRFFILRAPIVVLHIITLRAHVIIVLRAHAKLLRAHVI